jgi:transcriptional regulator with GAF, ATPase, and Fis domain
MDANAERTQFRAGLFYRLSVFPVDLPLLRDHPEDICSLVHHFAMDYAAHTRKQVTATSKGFHSGSCPAFMAWQSPGIARLH